jgi:hypothetical protein
VERYEQLEIERFTHIFVRIGDGHGVRP